MLVSGYWILKERDPYFIEYPASSIKLLNRTNAQFFLDTHFGSGLSGFDPYEKEY